MSNLQVRPQAEEEPALIEAAREAASEVLEAATEVERHIEKGTPQFMRTSLALFSGGFATFALLYCIQPMMPVLSKAFSISAAESSLALSVATAMLALGLLVTGPISDAIGRKPVMVVSLLAAALFTLGSAVMPTWHGVLLMRALVGLSLSGLAAVAMTYLSEEIHPQHIGLSMGLYIGGNAIGGMSGRLISGVLVDFISWHAALAVLGGLALVAALVFWRVLPESKHFRPAPLKPATLLNGYRLHFRDAGLPWLFLIGFLLMGSFVTLFNYIGYRLLAEPYHMSQAVVGVLSVVYLSGIYSSAWVGSLADKLGRRKATTAGTASACSSARCWCSPCWSRCTWRGCRHYRAIPWRSPPTEARAGFGFGGLAGCCACRSLPCRQRRKTETSRKNRVLPDARQSRKNGASACQGSAGF